MHELGEAKDEDASYFIIGPNENGVGEKGKEERQDELIVFFVLIVSIDDAEEDAGVLEERRAPEIRRNDIDEQKTDVDKHPHGEPGGIDVWQAFKIPPPGFKHNENLAVTFAYILA